MSADHQTLIADSLANHGAIGYDDCDGCECGADVRSHDAHRLHVAAALLDSLEFAAVLADVRAGALREAVVALKEYAEDTYWRDDSPFHAAQKWALGYTAADWLRDRADNIRADERTSHE